MKIIIILRIIKKLNDPEPNENGKKRRRQESQTKKNINKSIWKKIVRNDILSY